MLLKICNWEVMGSDSIVQYMNAVTNVGEHKLMGMSNEYYFTIFSVAATKKLH